MNIIFATKNDAAKLNEHYVVLELDTIKLTGLQEPLTAWCVIDTKDIALQDIMAMQQFRDLHSNLMENYRLRNWKYCEDALEHLVGKWQGEVDSFYTTIAERVMCYRAADPGPDWDGTIIKS